MREVAAVSDDAQPDLELERALAHPIRLRILEALRGRVASPAELSLELGEQAGVIAYHTATLVDCGCLEIVYSQATGRGGLENFFAITPRCLINRPD
jgi:DNA-binding transcriptional ArsR family regulator